MAIVSAVLKPDIYIEDTNIIYKFTLCQGQTVEITLVLFFLFLFLLLQIHSIGDGMFDICSHFLYKRILIFVEMMILKKLTGWAFCIFFLFSIIS